MSGERLHSLRRHSSFDPSGYREMPEAMPVEAFGRLWIVVRLFLVCCFKLIEQWQKFPLDHIVMAKVSALSIGKDQVVEF